VQSASFDATDRLWLTDLDEIMRAIYDLLTPEE
jgi:hypothetical protein